MLTLLHRLLSQEQLEVLYADFMALYEEHILDNDWVLPWEKYVEVEWSTGGAPDLTDCHEDAKLFADYLDLFVKWVS